MHFAEEKYKWSIRYVKMHNLIILKRNETMRNYAHHNIKGKLVLMLNNRNIYLLLMSVGYFLENTWEYPRETPGHIQECLPQYYLQ